MMFLNELTFNIMVDFILSILPSYKVRNRYYTSCSLYSNEKFRDCTISSINVRIYYLRPHNHQSPKLIVIGRTENSHRR